MEGEEDDFYINENDMNGAFHEDTVQIEVTEERARNGRRKEAKIVKILERGMTEIVGTFEKCKSYGFVVPDNLRFDSDIFYSERRMWKSYRWI